MTQEDTLTSDITDTLDIPHAPGQTITVRNLSWQHLKDARAVRKAEVMEELAALPSSMIPDMRNRCRRGCGEEKHKGACPPPEDGDQLGGNPVDEYDTETLLQAAVVSWSNDAPVSKANVNDLNEQTAMWLKAEIVRLNTAPTEGEQKN